VTADAVTAERVSDAFKTELLALLPRLRRYAWPGRGAVITPTIWCRPLANGRGNAGSTDAGYADGQLDVQDQ